jgi:hypothetical protein
MARRPQRFPPAHSLAAAALLFALAAGMSPKALGRAVPGREPGYHLVKYADSLVSLNDRCMVRSSRLNTHVRPVYVSGRPLGFC